nr:MAG TPA: hypothetical protein [Caudoviricetes sp.]
MTLTQKEAMVALLQGKTLCKDDMLYRLDSAGELIEIKKHDFMYKGSVLFKGFEIAVEWDLTFEDALKFMRKGRICRCEIAPEFNFWMNAKKRIVAGELTARLGPKANGHIVELCDDHFTAKWKVV